MTPEERRAIERVLSKTHDPVVVNLGAHRGEDEEVFRSCLRPGEQLYHLMVEPDPWNCAAIKRSPLSKNRVLLQGAVARTTERRPFRFSLDLGDGSRGSGSLLEPTGHLELFPMVRFWDPVEVECYSLDYIVTAFKLAKIDLLWADIQGAEKEMILGGSAALRRTEYCFMEAENQELYKGQAVKTELLALMKGWALVEDFDYNVLLRNTSLQETSPRGVHGNGYVTHNL